MKETPEVGGWRDLKQWLKHPETKALQEKLASQAADIVQFMAVIERLEEGLRIAHTDVKNKAAEIERLRKAMVKAHNSGSVWISQTVIREALGVKHD